MEQIGTACPTHEAFIPEMKVGKMLANVLFS